MPVDLKIVAPAREPVHEPVQELVGILMIGTIKSFSRKSGWGFVQLHESISSQDVFFHRADVNRSSGVEIVPAMAVRCRVVTTEKGAKASEITPLACLPMEEVAALRAGGLSCSSPMIFSGLHSGSSSLVTSPTIHSPYVVANTKPSFEAPQAHSPILSFPDRENGLTFEARMGRFDSQTPNSRARNGAHSNHGTPLHSYSTENGLSFDGRTSSFGGRDISYSNHGTPLTNSLSTVSFEARNAMQESGTGRGFGYMVCPDSSTSLASHMSSNAEGPCAEWTCTGCGLANILPRIRFVVFCDRCNTVHQTCSWDCNCGATNDMQRRRCEKCSGSYSSAGTRVTVEPQPTTPLTPATASGTSWGERRNISSWKLNNEEWASESSGLLHDNQQWTQDPTESTKSDLQSAANHKNLPASPKAPALANPTH